MARSRTCGLRQIPGGSNGAVIEGICHTAIATN
jgi:hypothetical protein